MSQHISTKNNEIELPLFDNMTYSSCTIFFFIFRTQCVTISEEKTFKPQRQEKVENEKNE